MQRRILFKEKEVASRKIMYFEVLRIIAVFLVIFNHTDENGFFLFSKYGTDTPHFWIYLFLSIFCKCAVFIFFAISGALLLGRETKSLKDLWRKKILRIVIVLILVSLVYYLIDLAKYKSGFDFGYFMERLYAKTLKYHLWYLYAYIAFLISLPFLQSLVKSMKKKHFIYMVGIAVFFGAVIPVLEYLFSKGTVTMNANMRVSWLISTIVLYPCIGYFLDKYVTVTKKTLLWAWAVNLVGIIISMVMTFIKGQNTGGQFPIASSQTFHSTFALLNCIAIFMMVKYICENRDKVKKKKPKIMMKKLVLSLGECTFGIYLVHLIFLKSEMCDNMFRGMATIGINKIVIAVVVCLWVLCLSYIVTVVLRKIPVIRRLL